MARLQRPLLCVSNAALLAFCTLGSGCASSTGPRDVVRGESAAAHTSQRSPAVAHWWDKPGSGSDPVLRAGTEVQWSVQSATAQPNRLMAGRAVVGPDGTIELGPYGSVKVAGLTYRQAKTAVAKQVGTYVANPQVGLAPMDAVANANRGPAGGTAVAANAPRPGQGPNRADKSIPARTPRQDVSLAVAADAGPSRVTWTSWQPPSPPADAVPPVPPPAAPPPARSLSQRFLSLFHSNTSDKNP
jgi:hypothetical protein